MVAKKVLLVGNFGVGKTSIIRRFVLNDFSEDYISTIGVRVSTKEIQIKNEEIKLLIWDIAGTNNDEMVPKAYFLGASAAMYVFDLSREETYINLEKQLEMIKSLSGLENIIVVGNKKDLVTEQELEEVKNKISVKVDIFTSAKDDDNVEFAFKNLALQSLN
ncbi:MAG: Rab family GTPase [Polaribacter sp.]|uniref:Rab family GTPase n=1 Tax=Polaribacter sp. TaxID=1920175 RepID=UPI003BAEB9BA